MIGAFFSDLRGVAATLDGVEAGLREREEMDVDGPRHHALQQTALHRFKGDVVDTKARMKTLQPTVVNLQKFGGLKEISGELLSLQRRRVEAARDALARYGYEAPPPAKLHKLDVGQNNNDNSNNNNEMKKKKSSLSSKAAEFEMEKENFASHHHSNNNGVVGGSGGSGGGGRVFDAPPIDVDEEMGDDDDALEEENLADGRETSNRRPSDNIASTTTKTTTTKIMTMTTTKSDRDHLRPSYNTGVVGDFPESPQCPILHSVGAVASAVVNLPPQPTGSASCAISAAAVTSGIADGDEEDDSVLAMELPPTPVYPEMTWKPDRDLPPPTAVAPMGDDLAAASAASTLLPLPRTPAPSFALVHTPTPPTLLSVSKKALDVTKIDFSGLEDGQVFHTGLTPKTPELHSNLTAMSTSQPADAKPPKLPTLPTRGGFLDTPSEGRATPSSPDSQQSFESLKRALKFNNAAEAPLPSLPSTSAAAGAAFMKPVSFVEFEQFKQQKVEGISRDLLNNAIKSLNAVFREREAAKESLDLPQTQVDALFNEDNDLRLGTKIILMLLKFKRIDCRSANGQSYVSPRTDDDDSMLDLTNYDD